MISYPVGDVVRCSTTFSLSSTPTDPTTVTFYLRGGLGTFITTTYAAGGVSRDGPGAYHYDFTVPTSGTYYYRWEGAGTVIAAAEGTFLGGPSYFK